MSAKKKLSAAIIGTGQIAGGYDQKKHKGDRGVYTHAGAFKKSGSICLQTVFDADPRKALAFSRAWGGAAAASANQILKGYHDIVCVCTPDDTHYGIAKTLILNKACKTIGVEKPAAQTSQQLFELMRLAKKNHVNVVVNFQRHFDPAHITLARSLKKNPKAILSVQGLYMKGLDHNGVTMLDTLQFLLGHPQAVMALRRVLNRQVQDHSYDFVLYYRHFSVTVRTTDSEQWLYNYHIFEIDLQLKDRRISIVDNSRTLKESKLVQYAYSGVRVLNDMKPTLTSTGYSTSMARSADYLSRITTGKAVHSQNTLESSYNNRLILDAIKKSYRAGLKKISLSENLWKK